MATSLVRASIFRHMALAYGSTVHLFHGAAWSLAALDIPLKHRSHGQAPLSDRNEAQPGQRSSQAPTQQLHTSSMSPTLLVLSTQTTPGATRDSSHAKQGIYCGLHCQLVADRSPVSSGPANQKCALPPRGLHASDGTCSPPRPELVGPAPSPFSRLGASWQACSRKCLR